MAAVVGAQPGDAQRLAQHAHPRRDGALTHAGGGLRAKLALLRVSGATWSAVGSLNGGEISHKVNREVVLLVDVPAIHTRLAEVFAWDWAASAP